MLRKSISLRILIIASLLLVNLQWGIVSASPVDSKTQSAILYVKPGADGDCLSWDTACELQTALFNATDGDQIWVASGTYKPTTSSNRETTFQLKNGVAIYGGFPSNGGAWGERDWESFVSNLNGDIGFVGDSADNSIHVVTGSGVDNTAILDGFSISGGNASGDWEEPDGHGGGMYNISGSPTLTNIRFLSNSASCGAGMYNDNSSSMLTNVAFISNSATSIDYGLGGGMYNTTSSLMMIDVTFNGNTAKSNGGGIYNDGGIISLRDVSFSNNHASDGGGMSNAYSNIILTGVSFTNNSSGSGGGIFNYGDGSSTLTNVTFAGNTAGSGGGMYNHFGSATLTNVTFIGNTASQYGGGMKLFLSNPTLTNVTFSENSSDDYGGGMQSDYSMPILTNVTFSGNTAEEGGGMHNYRGNPTLTNVTFSGNTATTYGGGMFNYVNNPTLKNVTFFENSAGQAGGGVNDWSASSTLTNAILWGNTPNQITGSSTVTYSDIQGGLVGEGNINADPLLGDLADNGGFTQTHALGATSPAIDVGSPDVCTTLDQRAYVRPTDGDGNGTSICDMGAYEFASDPAVFSLTVDVVGNGIVAKNPDKFEYLFGEVVTITPIADTNWVFTGWGGDASGYDNPLTMVIFDDTNIIANFNYDEWILVVSVSPEGAGSIFIDPVKATYHYGDEVTITAIPNLGATFAGWSGDASGAINPLLVTIYGNTEITANFMLDEYSLNVTVNPDGMGSVAISPLKPNYHYGDNVFLSATPATGWKFDGWSGDVTSNDNPLVLTIIGNTNVTANFTNIFYIYLPLILKN